MSLLIPRWLVKTAARIEKKIVFTLVFREEGRFEGGVWIKGGSPDLELETELPNLEPTAGIKRYI